MAKTKKTETIDISNTVKPKVVSTLDILQSRVEELEKDNKELFEYANSLYEQNKLMIEQLFVKQNEIDYNIDCLLKTVLAVLIMVLALGLFGIWVYNR